MNIDYSITLDHPLSCDFLEVSAVTDIYCSYLSLCHCDFLLGVFVEKRRCRVYVMFCVTF